MGQISAMKIARDAFRGLSMIKPFSQMDMDGNIIRCRNHQFVDITDGCYKRICKVCGFMSFIRDDIRW